MVDGPCPIKMNDILNILFSCADVPVIVATVVPVIVVILIIAMVFILYRRKPQLFNCSKNTNHEWRSVDKTGNVILSKNSDTLKIATDLAAADVRGLTEEFSRLEAEVRETILPNVKTSVGMAEENRKHNRYKDIGER